MAQARLNGLDGLRGIAALSIVLIHVFADRFSNAYLAVDFFFMLSGYIMARTFEGQLAAGRLTPTTFIASRVRRLYPVVFIGCLIGMPWLIATSGDRAWIIAIACLTLLPIGRSEEMYRLNPPAWSIAYELLANAVHGFVLARLSSRAVIFVVPILMVALMIATAGHGLGFVPTPGNRLATGLRTIVPYAIGVLLYRSWGDCPPFRIGPVLTWGMMPAVFLWGTFGPMWPGASDYVFVIVCCPILIAGGLTNGTANRVAAFAGTLSFPLYATHGPIVLAAKYMGFGWGTQLGAALCTGILVLLAQTMPGMANRWVGNRLARAPRAWASD
ncbi:acyltransferase family protein [Novosphingobium fluoreni]|uniref:acyltransferase family protein n=1 Tax=Novosphingobium fluoreni TaxID=1391222 RepID=UPI003DA0B5EB